MISFRDRVLSGEPLLLDGGTGTSLLARGLPPGVPPELWNLERPDQVEAVHRAFAIAGSDAVHTNTFGGNPVRLSAFGLEGRCEETNRAAVEIARRSGAAYVIADIGPTGTYLPPVGNATVVSWRAAFGRQARAFAGTAIDAVHVETMSSAHEAATALDAILEALPGIPVMVSMTFERKKRGFFTVMGDPLVVTLETLASCGALAVGANCSIASAEMRELMAAARPAMSIPLVAQPNAGAPSRGADGSPVYAQKPEEFAADMEAIASGGVNILGGCCGTDDRFIAALRARLGVRR